MHQLYLNMPVIVFLILERSFIKDHRGNWGIQEIPGNCFSSDPIINYSYPKRTSYM